MKRNLLVLLFASIPMFVCAQDGIDNRLGLSMSIKKSFIEHMDDAFNIGAGIRCNMTNKCYIGAQLEYMHVQGGIHDVSMEMDFVSMPIEVGYRVTDKNDMLGISPVIGFGINVAAGGGMEVKNKKVDMKIDGDTGVDLLLGVNVLLWCVEIGGRYHIPINDKQEGLFGEDAFFSVSAGIGLHKIF